MNLVNITVGFVFLSNAVKNLDEWKQVDAVKWKYWKHQLILKHFPADSWAWQKQSSRGALIKKCSQNMQQIYRKTPMPKCDFNKVRNFIEITLRRGCFPVNFLHIFRTRFPKNTSWRPLVTQILILLFLLRVLKSIW